MLGTNIYSARQQMQQELNCCKKKVGFEVSKKEGEKAGFIRLVLVSGNEFGFGFLGCAKTSFLPFEEGECHGLVSAKLLRGAALQ